MLRLMIVDDEINVIDGLKTVFDWKSMGYTIVASATSVAEAMEGFYEYSPDVIITDICMRDQDGLDLMRMVKEVNPSVEFVILSGYAKFDYAKCAFENNAYAYLLKPLDSNELISTMEKLGKEIMEKRHTVPEQFLYKLLKLSTPTEENIAYLYKKTGIDVPDKSYFLLSLHIDDKNATNEQFLYDEFSSLLREKVSQFTLWICQTEPQVFTILCFCSNERLKVTMCKCIYDVYLQFLQAHHIFMTMGVSCIFNSFIDVQDALFQTYYAISQRAVQGYGNMIYYRENMGNRLSKEYLSDVFLISSEKIAEILKAVREYDGAVVKKHIFEIFDQIEKLDHINIDVLRNDLAELAVKIIYTVAPTEQQAKIIYGEPPNPITDIYKFDLISDMREYMEVLVESILKHPELKFTENTSQVVRDVQIYIMLNYSNALYIDDIADELHLSRVHLMRMFKNETGITIKEFLTQYRMNVAKDLLRSGKYLVNEVGNAVGYSDSKYFCKVFKKITGVSPSKYVDEPEN